jgi:hypothetical protein
MEVKRFELETARAAGKAQEPRADGDPAPMRASPPRERENDERRSDDLEEPGYGHGV